MTTQPSPFEGNTVVGVKVAITKAGDGLSKALAVEPQALTIGETVYVVLETTVEKIVHAAVKDAPGSVIRVQSLSAGTATIVDESLVKDLLDDQRRKIEEASGILRLDLDGDGDDLDDDDLDDDFDPGSDE